MENLEEKIIKNSDKIVELKAEISKKIIGQDELVEKIIISLLCSGHVLIEGMPGLAKTLTISTLSKTLDLGFSRVQFTPDLLPSDLIGTEIFNQKTANFEVKKGPIFNNFILADEINRAPSKVQSALLEAMAEKNITIGNETFLLDEPFLVLATQNPIEQSGTYKLPEAELDRFFMKIKVSYPKFVDEKEVYKSIVSGENIEVKKILTKKEIFEIQKIVKEIYVSDAIFDYVTKIIDATRKPGNYDLGDLAKYLSFGASPRGGISLLNGAKALAFMQKRNFVIPEDIKKLAKSTLIHRIGLSYEAVADEIDEDFIIDEILKKIKIS